jgi:hypothetical protein
MSGSLDRATNRNARAHLLTVLLSAAAPHVHRMTAAKASAFLSNGRSANLSACRSSLVTYIPARVHARARKGVSIRRTPSRNGCGSLLWLLRP